MPQDKIYTIGYEGTNADQFTGALKSAGVKVLLDIRAVPLSRKPGFSKNKLAGKLAEHDIAYVGLKGLGTPAEGRAAARKGNAGEMRRIFTDHMTTDAAQKDLAEAIKIATATPSVLLCFEHEVTCCHRLIVAEIMADKTGMKIEHIDAQFAPASS